VALDANLRKFLFTSGPITEVGDEAPDGAASDEPGSLGIGSLRGALP
jgi:hypothetical protein